MIKEESWCSTEFSGIRWGDRRLEKRFVETAEKLSKQPLDSIHKACGSWADTKAAYRLFANEKVKAGGILSSHQEKTMQRMQGQERVLAVQDTSTLNFGERIKTRDQGLGPVGKKDDPQSFGFIMHTTLAVSLKGVSLGILDQQIWAREKERKGLNSAKHKPMEKRESYKWFKAMKESAQWAPPGTQLIHVSDRESDIYEYLVFAEQQKASYLVRAHLDRLVRDQSFYPLGTVLEKQPICLKQEIEVPAKKNGEAARTARVGIRFQEIELHPPPRRSPFEKKQGPLPPLQLSAVLVKEIDPPARVTPLEWMLLTNVKVTTATEAEERVNWYRMRWHIETFHKVLKSGCGVEACQLEGAERLKKYLSLFSVIAWRLYWMTHLSRQVPEASCSQLLESSEWKALYCRMKRTRTPPEQPPLLREAVRWIAQLGGFLARKGDGEPGPTVIWRGWQRLADITEDWLLFNGTATCG